jgi:ElaB/YqjD/DUF883 family membrane-anchored ribosome-binding protein
MLFRRKKSDSDEEFKKLKLHMQTLLNDMKSKIDEFRNLIISANISDEQKQEAFEMLDEAEGYLKSAENNINQNNMAESKKNVLNSQKLIEKCYKRVSKSMRE